MELQDRKNGDLLKKKKKKWAQLGQKDEKQGHVHVGLKEDKDTVIPKEEKKELIEAEAGKRRSFNHVAWLNRNYENKN